MLLLTKSHILRVLIVHCKSNSHIAVSSQALIESGPQVIHKTMQSIQKLFGPKSQDLVSVLGTVSDALSA